MIKKIGIILFFVVAARAWHSVPLRGLPLLSDTAFADIYTQDGQPWAYRLIHSHFSPL